MSSDEGGPGIVSSRVGRFFWGRGFRARPLVASAFFDLKGAFFGAAFLAAGRRREDDPRAGFAAFFKAFPAGVGLRPFDLEALFRAPGFFFSGALFFRDVLAFLLEEAAFRAPLALRLAMIESFRNLDSLAISVVLSDAYRKSDGRFRAPADRNCGPPDPAIRTPARVRVSHGNAGPLVRRQEECARHGKR